MTVLIGLTGPIGCGKSTVARWLGERPGVVVIDADEVAREVVEPGQPALEAIVERFGEGIRREDGTLDREALGRIVFADPVALRDLEAITHPAVRPRILAAIDSAKADGADAVVIEAIRLVEGGLAEICDEVWLVTCDPNVQRERLIGRGASADTAEQRIAAQSGLGERVRPVAARVLDTSGPPNRTKDEANAALDMALAT
ncbi:MAG: dephospho-CoA kinase [Chloroflexota bacterium]